MNVSEELIRSIVEKVLSETAAASSCGCGFEKHVDPSGVLSVKVYRTFPGRTDPQAVRTLSGVQTTTP